MNPIRVLRVFRGLKPFRVIRVIRVIRVFRGRHRLAFVLLLVAACLQAGQGAARQDKPFTFDAKTGSYHVYPKGRIQDALEAAAADPVNKKVYLHAGTFRPLARGNARRLGSSGPQTNTVQPATDEHRPAQINTG